MGYAGVDNDRRAEQRADQHQPILGPASCRECHLPSLWWFAILGWQERRLTGVVLGVRVYDFRPHRCTARDLTPQEDAVKLRTTRA